MSVRENEEQERLFLARLDDLCRRADKGELAISAFLSPREQRVAERYLTSRGKSCFSFGGYGDAERRRIYILPEYMEGSFADGESLSDFGYDPEICALRITGSGYRVLSHRDFLGSLLGLGIERSVIGDILISDESGREAVVLCDQVISDFIEAEMTHVANDKVRIVRANKGEWVAPVRKTRPIQDTVASPRLDAVVAALCNLSREKAREAVVSGLVEIEFESEERPDRTVNAPSVISVRGVGRFSVLSLSDKTKKGRYRLTAEKYI